MDIRVQSFINKEQLLLPQAKVIVGLSGGADSVALLHILHSLGYQCIAAHCNFKLRNEESDRDESFVREFVDEFKIPAHFINFETIEYAKSHNISIEMAARDLRYAWFEKIRIEQAASAIAVAHHIDDNVETLLMNLVRGTGLRGMTGIPVRNGHIIRPMLCFTREEILEYLVRYNLEFVEDSTNASSDYMRNKFRNEVFPLLEEINPSVKNVLSQTIDRFKGIQSEFQAYMSILSSKIVENQNDDIYIDIEMLKNESHPATVLFELTYTYGFHSDQIQDIVNQLDGISGKIFKSDTHRLLKDRKKLIINKIENIVSTEIVISENLEEVYSPIHLQFLLKSLNSDFEVSTRANRVHIDADKLKFPLAIRIWREGDTFVPFGMKGHKKISDFYIDQKLSIHEKEKTYLLVSGQDIVWVIGLRLDNRYKITEKTSRILEVSMI